MHCGVMVTGYNEGDWERLLAEDYSRPPAVSDARNMAIKLVPGGHPHHATAEAAANAAIAGDIAPLDVASIVLSSAKYRTRPGPKHPTDLIGVAHSPAYFIAARSPTAAMAGSTPPPKRSPTR
jgi:hypothetical protein